MRKKLIIGIISVILLTIFISGVTYSYFVITVSSNNNVSTSGKNFEVIYTGGTNIDGPITLATSKEGGASTTVNIRIAEGSVAALSNIYINVQKITSNIATDAFRWEVVGVKNGSQVYYNEGDFTSVNDTTNNIVTVVENYQLTEENTAFTIYLWLDGNKADSTVINSEFQGYIGAKTENFTGVTVS